jgi:hypothetical protein
MNQILLKGDKMDKAFNRKTSRILCVLISLALALGVIASVSTVGLWARAEESEDLSFQRVASHPSNNQFSSSTGSAPKTPDSWTGGGINGKGEGTAIGGVMELDSYASNRNSYKLAEDYPDEFPDNVAPDSPFGADKLEGTNRNVLFINVRPDGTSKGTAYGYTSSSVTLNANRFYRVSASVRTGSFAKGSGAAIRINGLDGNVAFSNINTVDDLYPLSEANNYGWNSTDRYGWEDFTFFVASSSYESQSVTISLQVGDCYTQDDAIHYEPATGYALFDNVEIFEISPSEFLSADESDHVKKFDYSAKSDEALATEAGSNLDFYNSATKEPSLDGWQRVAIGTNPNLLPIGVYDANSTFDKDNVYNLTSDPLSSNGKYRSGDSGILVLSSYRDGDFRSVAVGMSSGKFTLKRYHYYRVSAWVKTQDISDGSGSGATLALSVVRNEADKEYEGDNLFHTKTACNGNSENKSRGGYEFHSIFVKASVFKDYQASVECWLGTDGSESSGIAMFDNVTIEEISPELYTKHSGNGSSVDIDTAAGANGNTFRNFTDTGISNGEFYQIGEYDDFAYPLAPADWTKHTPDTVGTTDYSSNMSHIKTEDIISGIIPTDKATYEAHYKDFGENIINPRNGDGSVLMLYSKTPTAFCYRSSNFTVTADKPGALTVSLWAYGIDGYGASLVLKNDAQVIATIENIKNTNGFKEYTFYIEPNSADITTLSVEIWLGNIDRQSNYTKTSSGRVFVERVSYKDLEDDKAADGTTVTKSAATKFSEFKKAYAEAKHNGNSEINQAAYSFKTIDFDAFDAYDPSYVKYAYDWKLSVDAGESSSVRYGIFDPAGPGNDSTVTDSFKNSEGGAGYGILMLENKASAASKVSYNGSIALKADTYYKIDVSLRVSFSEAERNNEKSVGATLSLSGTDFAFKNIKDTAIRHGSDTDATVLDENFRTYTFYIKAGSTESSVSLALSLGDSTSSSKWISGKAYVNNVSYTDITNVAYDEAVAAVKDGKEYSIIADLSTPDDADSDDNTSGEKGELAWWLIPSILFAIAILIAIIGFITRKAIEKRAAKKGVIEKTVSYDRRATLNQEHNKNADEEEKVSEVVETGTTDEQYESFDDDSTVSETAKPKAETAQEVPAETVSDEVNETTETATEEKTETENGEGATETSENTDTTKIAEAPAQSPVADDANKSADDSFIDRFDD